MDNACLERIIEPEWDVTRQGHDCRRRLAYMYRKY